jgi:5-methylcytosine-specific restriction endonuclease McrA
MRPYLEDAILCRDLSQTTFQNQQEAEEFLRKSGAEEQIAREARRYFDYESYLQSGTWHRLREQRMAHDDGRCFDCQAPAVDVHHVRYEKEWGEETVADLVSLCRTCHDLRHADKPDALIRAVTALVQRHLANAKK